MKLKLTSRKGERRITLEISGSDEYQDFMDCMEAIASAPGFMNKSFGTTDIFVEGAREGSAELRIRVIP